MKKTFLYLLLIVGSLTQGYSAVRGAYHQYFSLEGDYVVLRRANSSNKHLVSAASGPIFTPIYATPPQCRKEVGKPMLETKDLINDMHFNSGFSVAAKIYPSIYSTWEARYLGGFAWHGKKMRNCPENLNLDGILAEQTVDYQNATRAKAVYLSKMYTYELNHYYHITPRHTDHFSISWIVGLRYFNIDEKLKMYFTNTIANPIMAQTSRYRVRTENTSFGLQTGGIIEYNPYHFLTWGLVTKVGGLFNRDKQRTLMLDNNNTDVIRDYDRSGSNFAYMAHVYPFIELRPTKHFFFYINYQMLYIGAIATAEKNLQFHGEGNLLDHGGHIIYHGATGGIQFNF